MRKIYWSVLLIVTFLAKGYGQEIKMTGTASLKQVYGEMIESESLLPFNDLDIEFGYVLYQTEINTEPEDVVLELENVRDYAAIYIDGKLHGTLTDNNKKLNLNIPAGQHILQLYTENIGRITYGPEILDNSKGLFGSVTLDGEDIENWAIIPLNVRDYDITTLTFEDNTATELPCFYKGTFNIDTPTAIYLDISGWGMGEVWVNGKYMGSYWEEEKQQSIQISANDLKEGKNDIVVFELKNNKQTSMKLSQTPVFK